MAELLVSIGDGVAVGGAFAAAREDLAEMRTW
jgi:hypothetical protein